MKSKQVTRDDVIKAFLTEFDDSYIVEAGNIADILGLVEEPPFEAVVWLFLWDDNRGSIYGSRKEAAADGRGEEGHRVLCVLVKELRPGDEEYSE